MKKSANIDLEAAFMRAGNKTMPKKAVENQIKSMTYNEKSGFAGDLVFWDGGRRQLWSIPVLHAPERLVFTDV